MLFEMLFKISSSLCAKGLRVTQNAHFSLSMHTKQLLLVTLCDTTAGIGNHKVWQTQEQTESWNKLAPIPVVLSQIDDRSCLVYFKSEKYAFWVSLRPLGPCNKENLIYVY